jgi:glycosyltransferase involved in cell wall biosynthesis
MRASITWMNVTSSFNWHRPPVGIIRVEQRLCEELKKLFPAGLFKTCIWNGTSFIDFSTESEMNISAEEIDYSNKILPGDTFVSLGLDWDYPYLPYFFHMKNNGVRIITCCYDCIPILYPQYCLQDVAKKFSEYFIDLSELSYTILCISKQSKMDLKHFQQETGANETPLKIMRLGDNIPAFCGDISDTVKQILSSKFIIYVSSIERRKNHEVLYRAYHILCTQGYKNILPKLIFVGMPGWGVTDLMRDINDDPLVDGLIFQLNYVTDAELKILYEKSEFCLFPSLYEGWGLPVAEALVQGKMVLSSDKGSLPEVGGDLVKYLDPWNASAWAEAIIDFVKHPDKVKMHEELIKKNYIKTSWSDTALAVKEIVDNISSTPVETLSDQTNSSYQIDFTNKKFPSFIDFIQGLSVPEAWGRWSDINEAPSVSLVFKSLLPNRFTLYFQGIAFGPNVGQTLKINISNTIYKIIITNDCLEFSIDINLEGHKENIIEFIPPKPISPQELGLGFDTRKIAIGFVKIEINTNKC